MTTSNRWTVGTFYRPGVWPEVPKIDQILVSVGAYARTPDIIEFDVEANSASDAQHRARLMRLSLESALEGMRDAEVTP